MNEMSAGEIRTLKRKFGLSNAQLSDESGVPLGTVNKILSGATDCPRSETLAALATPLRQREEEERRRCSQPYVIPAPADSLLMEEAISYGVPADRIPGTFTIEDYYALPDDHRVELIDGFFYDMAAPTTIHQSIALTVVFAIKTYIKQHGGSCTPFISPVDVQLSIDDDKTMVQPDVLVVCDPSKIHEKCIIGAPDFILEIISPSSKHKDYYKKGAKYAETGVREYWIIDPKKQLLTIYNYKSGDPIEIHPLSGKMGIGIFGGQPEIDLDEIAGLCKL